MTGLSFPSSQETSQRQTSPTTVPETVMGHHDGCHDMMFHGLIEFFEQKRHDMVGDTDLSETRRGGSGRQRRRSLGDDEGVEKASLLLRKRGRTDLLVCATFSGFKGA